MNLFIAAAGLPADRLAALRAVGTDFEIDGAVGIVVDDAALPGGARVTAHSPSPFEGIAYATLEWPNIGEMLRQRLAEQDVPRARRIRRASPATTPAEDEFVEVEEPPVPTVKVGTWTGGRTDEQRRQKMAVLAGVLLPYSGGRDVVVSFTDSKPSGTVAPMAGAINIVLGVGERIGTTNPSVILGHTLGEYSWLKLAEAQYLCDAAGVAFVRKVGDELYEVPHLLGYTCSDKEQEVFKTILEEMKIEFFTPPEERTEIRKQQAEARRIASRGQYVKECARRFEKTVAGTRDAITRGHADVESLQQQLVRRIRETSGAERKLEQMLGTRGDEEAKYASEFDKLVSTHKVRDVVAEGGVIKVFTDTLYCTDPRSGKRHEIGVFQIELQTDRGDVRWFNLTRQVDGYKARMQAPHVWYEGHACLGTAAEILPQLIGGYEFAAAAMVAIQFVESVNTDDGAGKHINRWPEAAV